MTQKPPSLPNEAIDQIMDAIAQADTKYLATLIEDLTEKNAEFTQDHNGFLYGHVYYSLLDPRKARHVPKVPLHVSLHDEGDVLVNAHEEFSNDGQRLIQGLTILLRDCQDEQDLRDALPNIARMALPQLTALPRTREVAYTLADKPLLLAQYPQTEELLTYYLTSRMIF